MKPLRINILNLIIYMGFISCNNHEAIKLPSDKLIGDVVNSIINSDSVLKNDSVLVSYRFVKFNFERKLPDNYPPPPNVFDSLYYSKSFSELFLNAGYKMTEKDSLYMKIQTDSLRHKNLNAKYFLKNKITDSLNKTNYLKDGFKIAIFHEPLFNFDSSIVITQFDIVNGMSSCLSQNFNKNERSVTIILQRQIDNWKIKYKKYNR